MHTVAKMAVAVALVAGLSGCTAMTGRSASRNVSDAEITTSVKSHLAAEKASTVTSIDVDTVRGVVYLNGVVADAQAKQRATEIARKVDGVEKVVNNLQTRTVAGDAPVSRGAEPPHSTY